MTWITDTLNQALGGEELRSISRQIGADEQATANALQTTLPVLIGALQRNATQSGGAEQLFQAVSQDHDGSLLDHLGYFLNHAEAGAGEEILGHLLGPRRPSVEAGLSRASGLDSRSMAKLLTILAPMVMAALGKAHRNGQLDSRGINDLLNQEAQAVEQQNPQAMGVLSRLLDADNDGDVDMGDLVRHGFGLLRRILH
ncbi:hypothetical protein DESUT3_17850 [Desulfuromonas versatilis]|uniref:DUF937 domain-containing protein n=1 Tax=Desulfuromonas versatilis TaxID=2802975 RepID=A0ABM8HUI6_9BACT|nr:DUF937 domain-containing protein [Desulfuromonas versatilis]BCR04716.1 hypothetical protein DESUT3_17850 [Desulfuromonas versatilis]